MSLYDINVPNSLKEIQEWFGSAITTPLDSKGNLKKGMGIEKKAIQYLAPSPTLKPHQRIEIYNQQYYWRLYNILHETFPIITRILGPREFNNTLASPYLHAYVPNTWCINYCGNQFPEYLEKAYRKKDRELFLQAAKLDLAYNLCYFAEEREGIDSDALKTSPETVLNTVLQLRPSTYLFAFSFDLLDFRNALLKEPINGWLGKKLPPLLKKETFVLVHRVMERVTKARTITKGEYSFFSAFKEPRSVAEACEWIETQPEELQKEAEDHLGAWVQTLITDNLCFKG